MRILRENPLILLVAEMQNMEKKESKYWRVSLRQKKNTKTGDVAIWKFLCIDIFF